MNSSGNAKNLYKTVIIVIKVLTGGSIPSVKTSPIYKLLSFVIICDLWLYMDRYELDSMPERDFWKVKVLLSFKYTLYSKCYIV